nr:MAG TPA: hypothetical protein [Caudoviricetes sp.]
MKPTTLKYELKELILPLLYFIKKNPTSIPPDLNILAENQLSS